MGSNCSPPLRAVPGTSRSIVKPSHTSTPRQLSDCWFQSGYAVSQPEPVWEIWAGYVLAFVIGCSLAAVLFFGLSK